VKKNGEIIDALVSAIGETDQDGKIFRSLAVSIDVTERIRAEQALKQAKDELSRYSEELERLVRLRTEEITSILKYTPDVVYIKDIQGRYLLVNPKFEELFGVRNEQIRGKTAFECVSEKLANQVQISDTSVLEEKSPVHEEIQLTQKDGIHTYLSVKFPIYDDSGNISGVGGISTDITELKKVEAQLRRLSGSMIASQEKERAYVARELHDELGQMLTALRMETSWLVKRLKAKDAAAAERAEMMCDMIDKTIGDVRGIALRLRPGVLDTLGLVDALEWYASEFEKRNRIACIFRHNKISLLANSIATTAYRITQESLTNITRHASASLVNIDLCEEDGILNLMISDNGRGFDPALAAESERLGIAGMRERAMLVGGRLEVDSTAGHGTRVFFRLKL
jgi:PAS domain S-box-containing protein